MMWSFCVAVTAWRTFASGAENSRVMPAVTSGFCEEEKAGMRSRKVRAKDRRTAWQVMAPAEVFVTGAVWMALMSDASGLREGACGCQICAFKRLRYHDLM